MKLPRKRRTPPPGAASGVFLALALLLLGGCGLSARPYLPSGDVSAPAHWLTSGPQSRPGPDLDARAAHIRTGRSDLETVRNVLRDVWNHHYFETRAIGDILLRSADELATTVPLGGCSEFALIDVALLRAKGLPARMVATAEAGWLRDYREVGFGTTRGHTYVEVWAERKWYLVDPARFQILADYDPAWTCYPHNQVFFARGLDFWDMGLRNTDDVNRDLRAFALRHTGTCREPAYSVIWGMQFPVRQD